MKLRVGRSRFGRRWLLRRFGTGWLAMVTVAATGSLVSSLGGCAPVGRSKTQNVGTLKLLDEEGKILLEYFSSEPLLVIRSSKDKKDNQAISAVSPSCPHQGCLVNWKADQTAFICPCHGARFDAQGKLLQGPATANLKRYDVEVRGEDIWVSSQPK